MFTDFQSPCSIMIVNINKVMSVTVSIVVINFSLPQTLNDRNCSMLLKNSFVFVIDLFCVFVKIFMTELFLHWDLFLVMPAPIWYLEPHILFEDKLIRILEIINLKYPAHAEQVYFCFQGLRTTKMTFVTPQIHSITGTSIQFFSVLKVWEDEC